MYVLFASDSDCVSIWTPMRNSNLDVIIAAMKNAGYQIDGSNGTLGKIKVKIFLPNRNIHAPQPVTLSGEKESALQKIKDEYDILTDNTDSLRSNR